jgi:hypothetical protein
LRVIDLLHDREIAEASVCLKIERAYTIRSGSSRKII